MEKRSRMADPVVGEIWLIVDGPVRCCGQRSTRAGGAGSSKGVVTEARRALVSLDPTPFGPLPSLPRLATSRPAVSKASNVRAGKSSVGGVLHSIQRHAVHKAALREGVRRRSGVSIAHSPGGSIIPCWSVDSDPVQPHSQEGTMRVRQWVIFGSTLFAIAPL